MIEEIETETGIEIDAQTDLLTALACGTRETRTDDGSMTLGETRGVGLGLVTGIAIENGKEKGTVTAPGPHGMNLVEN
jgi:hypothetical protein